MSGTSSQVLNPPSLYSNLYSSLYLNVEFTDSLLKISMMIAIDLLQIRHKREIFVKDFFGKDRIVFSEENNIVVHSQQRPIGYARPADS